MQIFHLEASKLAKFDKSKLTVFCCWTCRFCLLSPLSAIPSREKRQQRQINNHNLTCQNTVLSAAECEGNAKTEDHLRQFTMNASACLEATERLC